MADKPIDLERERNKRLPHQQFIELPEEDEPNMNLVELFTRDGDPLVGRVGLRFEVCDCTGPIPAVALTAKQCRALGHALLGAAEHLEESHESS